MDLESTGANVTFTPFARESCVDVVIQFPVGLEMIESFFVTLERTDGLDEQISISESANVMEIEIINDRAYDRIFYIQCT